MNAIAQPQMKAALALMMEGCCRAYKKRHKQCTSIHCPVELPRNLHYIDTFPDHTPQSFYTGGALETCQVL